MNFYKQVVCADGFAMSVQAGGGHYCRPRIDDAERYEAVEVGYPNEEEPLLMPYVESAERPCDTVYPYVPSDKVSLVIAKHGGIVSGELPPGIPYLRPTS